MQPCAAGSQVSGRFRESDSMGSRRAGSYHSIPPTLAFFTELCGTQEPPTLNAIFRTMASEHIPDLPPGGGLACK